MKLAIADPPYLGRANRWYGDGRGSSGGRHVADHHPEARRWDDPAEHVALVARLESEFDGWAIAAAPDSMRVYWPVLPFNTRVMIWHRRNAPPSGSRVGSMYEPVIVRVPDGRSGRRPELLEVADVLDHPAPRRNFAGAKPDVWTRWVLAALGYLAGEDELTDVFAGSGAVAAAADGLLALAHVSTEQESGR